MKKHKILAICVCLLITGCVPKGKTDSAKIEYGDTEKFTQNELKAAADTVLERFGDFPDCELETLKYSEEKGFVSDSDYDFQWILGREDDKSEWEILGYGEV